jgi:glycosyltransferase involved in cell wall biosynthesis
MRVLFVGFPYSVHAARWTSLVADQGWDLHFFPSQDNDYIHPDFRNIAFWSGFSRRRPSHSHQSVRMMGFWPFASGQPVARKLLEKLGPSWLDRPEWLAWVIRMLDPDIVHSMEFQHASYLAYAAKQRSGRPFPTWIATNWGCDIQLYGRLPEHRAKITDVLRSCDYYSCECQRDVRLARQLGLRGEVLPVVPNGGGLDLEHALSLRQPGTTSARRVIALKGYHRHMHRAQVGLRALALCADVLRDYTIRVFAPEPREIIEMQAEVITGETGLAIELMPPVRHDEMLRLHGSARISISLSLADGICTSMLEAMAMGSFPIQSNTACANEWVEDGISAFLVPPEDPHAIADRIRQAILSDRLVDEAAARNADTVRERLDRSQIKMVVVEAFYQRVFAERSGRPGTDATGRAIAGG